MPGRSRPDSPGSTEYFANLAAVRGIAALMVGLYHVCTTAFNDPAGATNGAVRRVYDRDQLEDVWINASGGTAYVINR